MYKLVSVNKFHFPTYKWNIFFLSHSIDQIAVVLLFVAYASAKPGIVAPLAYSAPLVAAPYVAAQSSQVVARNYNGFAAPLLAAPAAYRPYAASPYTVPFAYASPYAAAYTHPYSAAYASPYAYAAAAPLKYTAAPVLL